MKSYKGSCHCGEVAFEVEADFPTGIECNCSMCLRKGTILAFTTPDKFKLISGENSLADYQFHKKLVHHTFCKHCGVTAFVSGKSPNGHDVKAINLRCLEDFDIKSLKIQQVDGRSF